jgi:hypothetical protein
MRNKVIFSVYQGSNKDEFNHKELMDKLKGFNPIEAEGMYQGVAEKSIAAYGCDSFC